jgi:hypothetical protein
MKMNLFLMISIGVCVFILLYAVTTIAYPEIDGFNWAVSMICGNAINIGLITSQNKRSHE